MRALPLEVEAALRRHGFVRPARDVPPDRPWWHFTLNGASRWDGAAVSPPYLPNRPGQTWRVPDEYPREDCLKAIATFDAANPIPFSGLRHGQVWWTPTCVVGGTQLHDGVYTLATGWDTQPAWFFSGRLIPCDLLSAHLERCGVRLLDIWEPFAGVWYGGGGEP